MNPTGNPPRRRTQQHDSAPPPQLTAALTTDSAHPAVVDRMMSDMRAMAVLLDGASGQFMAAEGPWAVLEQLSKSVEDLHDEASIYRPELALTHGLDLARLLTRPADAPGGAAVPDQAEVAARQASGR